MENEIVNIFIIEQLLINPISEIITKLENNDYRDCDIKWLNDKLHKYTSFALETFNKKFTIIELNYELLNGFVKEKFLKYFNILLEYFKSFLNDNI